MVTTMTKEIRHDDFPAKGGRSMKILTAAYRRGWWLLLAATFCLSALPAYGKGGDQVWHVSDPLPGKQEARAMASDSAGNVIVAGYTSAGGSNDYQVTKFKADGSGVAWRATYDMAGGDDVATAVAVDANDDVIVTGYAWSGLSYDIHTIKYRGSPAGPTGEVLWEHTFASTVGAGDFATAIAVDNGNNIYVAGYTVNAAGNDDFLIIKYPPEGTVPQWQEIWNSSYNDHDRITAIAAGSDGIAVTGYSSKGGTDFDIVTRKYGFDGSLVRAWRASSSGSRDDRGTAVRLDSTGNVLVAGYTSSAVNTDIYLAKYSPASDTPVWERSYDGGFNDEPRGLWLDGDDTVYLTGISFTLAGHEDICTIRYNSDGTKVWSDVFNSGGELTDIPAAITGSTAPDGGLFVTGYSHSSTSEDYITLKYDKVAGTVLWSADFDGAAAGNDRPVGIVLSPAGNPLVAGWSEAATSYDFQVVQYDFGPLNAPTGLTATADSNSAITLGWQDNSANEDGFRIERKLGEAGTYTQVGTVGPGVTTFTQSGLSPDNYYYFRVLAYNAADGDSRYSNEAHALTKVVSYDTPDWIYRYNGADDRDDIATAITVGPDDNPVVAGFSDLTEEGVAGMYSYDYLAIKLDRADATVKWKARYDSGDGGTDMATGVALDPAGDLLMTGTSYLSGGTDKSDDLYTIKFQTSTLTDPAGSPPILWGDQYGTQSGIDMAIAIQVVRDGSGNSVVIGYGMNAAGNNDIFIIKYREDGSRAWPPIVYDGGRDDYPTGVALDSAGNIFVTGYSTNAEGNEDFFTAKYNGATGAPIWAQNYDGPGHGNDRALSLALDAQGDLYVTGYGVNGAGDDQFVTIKYAGADSAAQREIWRKTYDGPAAGNDRAVAVRVDPIDDGVVVAGNSYRTADDSDFHLIRYNAADGTVIWEKNFDRPASYDYPTDMVLDPSGYIYLTGEVRNGPDTDPASDNSSDILTLIYDFEGTFLGATVYNGTANLHDEAMAIAVNLRGEAFVAGYSPNPSNDDYIVLKQKNRYILVPSPLSVAPQSDASQLALAWHDNSPGSQFRIERTASPVTSSSVWEPVTIAAAGSTGYTDSGLTAGHAYCYRIDAFSGSINSRKIVQCATTTLPATTLNALNVDSGTGITVAWNQVAGNTGYRVERKTDAAGSWSAVATIAADTTGYADTGLTPGTTYYYRVLVASDAGYSLPSNELSAVTRPAPPILNTPSGLGIDRVTITWSDVAGETGYRIERKEGAAGSWSQAGTTGKDTVTFTDAGLAPNTRYYYRVAAYNAGGDSVYSAEQGALTLFVSPTLASATGSASSSVDLAWTDVAGETGFTIQESSCTYNNSAWAATYCTSANLSAGVYWGSWHTVTDLGAGQLAYQRSGLGAGSAVAYRVVATTTGNSSAPSNWLIAWTYLATPAISVSPQSETALTISWGTVPGASNYTLERKQLPTDPWTEVTGAVGLAATATTFTDQGLALQTAYSYRLKAYSTIPGGPPAVYSNEVNASTPPSAPVLAPLSIVSSSEIDLAWNGVPGSTGYDIQRCVTRYPDNPEYLGSYAQQSWLWNCTTPVSVPTGTVSYRDQGLTPGYGYRYFVRSSYAGGTTAWSTDRLAITNPPPPTLTGITVTSATQLNLTWGNVAGETEYRLEWKPRTGADCSTGTWNGPIAVAENTTSYAHSGLTAGTFYCYRMQAYNPYGISTYGNELSAMTAVSPPVLDAPAGVSATQAALTWNNVPGNAGYRIEQRTGTGGTWGTAGTVGQDTTGYTASGLTAGTLYYFRVSAANANAVYSVPSNEVSATTTPAATTVATSVVSGSRIDLSWPLVKGATAYPIERRTGTGSYEPLTSVATPYAESYCGFTSPTVNCPAAVPVVSAYSDTGLAAHTTYCYRMTAWNSTGGNSPDSTETCATTSALPGQELTATAVNPFKIALSWTSLACSPGPCSPPAAYRIEREVRPGIWAEVATVDGSTTSYLDTTGIAPNAIHHYRLSAIDGADSSPYSEATVTTPVYTTGENCCP